LSRRGKCKKELVGEYIKCKAAWFLHEESRNNMKCKAAYVCKPSSKCKYVSGDKQELRAYNVEKDILFSMTFTSNSIADYR
jgi:hypothetical protein